MKASHYRLQRMIGILLLFAALTSQGKADVAYVYDFALSNASAFKTFLDGRGYPTTLIAVSHVSTTDFSTYSAILLGSDTGFWWLSNHPSDINIIVESQKQIVALGEGGQYFLGTLLLNTGYPHCWHGDDKGIVVTYPENALFHKPNVIPLGSNNSVYLYTTTSHVAVYLPTFPPGVVAFGREIDNNKHFPITLEQGRYWLWGFTDSPTSMTAAGKDLFENLLHVDADEDAIADISDNCLNTPNADQANNDGDSLGNVCDNCPNMPNDNQADMDHDGVGDVCDDDRDGDGLANTADNCPNVNNTGQEDSDGDLVGDACDACPDTLIGTIVDALGCRVPIRADFDDDGDVDQEDFGHLQACFTAGTTPSTDPACDNAHLARKVFISQDDLTIFLGCMKGPNVIADPACAP